MSAVIGVMGESGSGKTTAMRNLPPKQTFYCDCDKKGMIVKWIFGLIRVPAAQSVGSRYRKRCATKPKEA